ncbi:MAG: TlpA family protein disulfide reductase [Deltaproteobacteria bacterium]|nr:TlpA family protein disulfide reductase [Deltaproteobacteria bacterium]
MNKQAFAFFVLCASLLVGSAALAGKLKVGDKAPDFMLRDREGNMHRLSDVAFKGKETSYRKKKKVLIDFFRTDCKPCMQELPEIIKFHGKHKDKVQVLMIALLEEKGGRDKLNNWLKANKLPFPVLVDAYETVAKKYIVDGETLSLPSIFFIDENGIVRAQLVGLKKDLETELGGALGTAVQ